MMTIHLNGTCKKCARALTGEGDPDYCRHCLLYRTCAVCGRSPGREAAFSTHDERLDPMTVPVCDDCSSNACDQCGQPLAPTARRVIHDLTFCPRCFPAACEEMREGEELRERNYRESLRISEAEAKGPLMRNMRWVPGTEAQQG